MVIFAVAIASDLALAGESAVKMPNPASANCLKQGGSLSILKRGDGGEYGLCLFEDGKQCEEWALFRGDCPAGGVKVAGYATVAARYCVVTGGIYRVTAKGDTDREQGTCTDSDGRTCDAWEYFSGGCDLSR